MTSVAEVVKKLLNGCLGETAEWTPRSAEDYTLHPRTWFDSAKAETILNEWEQESSKIVGDYIHLIQEDRKRLNEELQRVRGLLQPWRQTADSLAILQDSVSASAIRRCAQQLESSLDSKCPNCGLGRDTDGDGNCAICKGKPLSSGNRQLSSGEWGGLPCPHDSAECLTVNGKDEYSCSDCGAPLAL